MYPSQVFNYDPIQGLIYSFIEVIQPLLELDFENLPKISAKECLEMYFEMGLILLPAQVEITETPSIIWNYGICKEKGEDDWYDFDEVPSHAATDEIIKMLNE